MQNKINKVLFQHHYKVNQTLKKHLQVVESSLNFVMY